MDFKVKTPTFWEDYQYFVNEEKRTVVAKKDNFCSDFYRKLDEFYGSTTGPEAFMHEFILRSWVVFCHKRNYLSLTAKATCSKEDEFSTLIGTEIARIRLETKTQKIYGDFFAYIEEELENVIFNFCRPTYERVVGKEKFLMSKLVELFLDIDVTEGE